LVSQAKSALFVIIASAIMAVPAVSKPKTYDHIAKLTIFDSTPDYRFTTEVNGHSYTFACDVDSHNVACKSGSGIYWGVKFDDGTSAPANGNTPLGAKPRLNPATMGFWFDGFNESGDPLLGMIVQATIPPGVYKSVEPVVVGTFHYRFSKEGGIRTFYLPLNVDSKGRAKGEACYLAP
jgi:hypothetical protein